jgi:hypothetical protein
LGNTRFSGKGNDRKVYAFFIIPRAYDRGLKREELQSIANHERQHVNQHIGVKSKNTDWRKLDNRFETDEYKCFREAEAYIQDMDNGSWKYIATRFEIFSNRYYTRAEQMFSQEINPTRPVNQSNRSVDDIKLLNAMKTILQKVYKDVPFVEMKNKNYQFYIRSTHTITP